jgi:organic radical activating enzyme
MTGAPHDVHPRLVVNEIFGPTVQGEGPSSGHRCAFLRLGGCNLSCRWCDTPYTWDWKGVADEGHAYRPADELHPMAIETVLSRLLAFDVGLIVLSGGEPLSQQHRLMPVIHGLKEAGLDIEIETNGTVAPLPELVASGVRFNVSPKLAHSGDPERRRLVPEVLRAFAELPPTIFKFDDLDEVERLVTRFALRPVWIMPLGRTTEELIATLRKLADSTISRGWNLTSRMHVLAWETQRGV